MIQVTSVIPILVVENLKADLFDDDGLCCYADDIGHMGLARNKDREVILLKRPVGLISIILCRIDILLVFFLVKGHNRINGA